MFINPAAGLRGGGGTAAPQRRVQALGDVDSWARVKLRFTMLLMCSGKICIFSFTLNAHKVDAFS